MIDQLGFFFTEEGLRQFMKSHLDKLWVTKRFTDNLSTRRFMTTFLSRHPGLILRKTNAFKLTRATLSREEIQKFFDNFQKIAERDTTENMYNLDEMNA
jgi:hypothetical protein